MRGWQDEQLSFLQAACNEQECFHALERIADGLGFEFCAYGARVGIPVMAPRFALFSNYPIQWQTRYREQRYFVVDPTVEHGLHSIAPIVWNDMLFVPCQAFWEEARSFGLRYGWAQSIRDASGTVGMLTLARSDEPLSDAELQDKVPRLVWLSQLAHLSISPHLTNQLVPESRMLLTSREKSVLGWTAEGKTSGEVSDILGISERSVNFHICNAMRKLNAPNKIAATVRAALLGML